MCTYQLSKLKLQGKTAQWSHAGQSCYPIETNRPLGYKQTKLWGLIAGPQFAKQIDGFQRPDRIRKATNPF